MLIQGTKRYPDRHGEKHSIAFAVTEVVVIDINPGGSTRVRLKTGENILLEEPYEQVCNAIHTALIAQQTGS